MSEKSTNIEGELMGDLVYPSRGAQDSIFVDPSGNHGDLSVNHYPSYPNGPEPSTSYIYTPTSPNQDLSSGSDALSGIWQLRNPLQTDCLQFALTHNSYQYGPHNSLQIPPGSSRHNTGNIPLEDLRAATPPYQNPQPNSLQAYQVYESFTTLLNSDDNPIPMPEKESQSKPNPVFRDSSPVKVSRKRKRRNGGEVTTLDVITPAAITPAAITPAAIPATIIPVVAPAAIIPAVIIICDFPGCSRKKKPFSKKHNLIQHRRNVHKENIPKVKCRFGAPKPDDDPNVHVKTQTRNMKKR